MGDWGASWHRAQSLHHCGVCVLDRVSAGRGSSLWQIECTLGGCEVVQRALAGCEQGLAEGAGIAYRVPCGVA
jgi:hypothetical protein